MCRRGYRLNYLTTVYLTYKSLLALQGGQGDAVELGLGAVAAAPVFRNEVTQIGGQGT